MREFVDLKSVYQDLKLSSENYSVYYGQASPEELEELKKLNYSKPWYTDGLEANVPYVTLFKNGHKVMMSDVPMEKNTNQHFIDNANGDVLIFGLGLGLIILPLLQDKDIISITVIELDRGLIDVVGPILKKYDIFNKITIIQEDAFTAKNVLLNKKFDTIYFDIWISILADNFKEMEKLHLTYSDNLNKENSRCFIDSWCYEYCKKLDWQTSEFLSFLKKELPDKVINIESEKLFVDGVLISHMAINDSFLNSQHRFSKHLII